MTTQRLRTSILLPAIFSVGFACGARTPLPLPEGEGGSTGEGASGPTTTTTTSGPTAPSSTTGDGGGGNDGSGGQGGGGGPPIEECDPDTLFIYLVTSERDLYRFDPAALDAGLQAFTLVGNLACPTELGGTPFSMAVSRSGRAYAVYNSGELFRVNVKTAACTATDWLPLGGDFNTFGMGYALDDDGEGETLHVADIPLGAPDQNSAGLARLDTATQALDFIGPFSQNPGNSIEMTSADDGELYGYFINDLAPGGTLVRIDKDTAEILEAVLLPAPANNTSSLAFAYWNGDFFIFTGENDGAPLSQVTRYRPTDGSVVVVATLDRIIVGAGVSTCDPDEAR